MSVKSTVSSQAFGRMSVKSTESSQAFGRMSMKSTESSQAFGRMSEMSKESSQARANMILCKLSETPWANPAGFVYFRQDVADAPCKDYFQLVVTPDLDVEFRLWTIQFPYRSSVDLSPQVFKSACSNFKKDVFMRVAIQSRLRGEVDFLDRLLEGTFNYLDRLDEDLKLNIISFLDVCSVLRLGSTCRSFRKLCDDDSIWKSHFMCGFLEYYVTPGLMTIREEHGWKHFYLFMKKLARYTDEIGSGFVLKKTSSRNVERRRASLKSQHESYSAPGTANDSFSVQPRTPGASSTASSDNRKNSSGISKFPRSTQNDSSDAAVVDTKNPPKLRRDSRPLDTVSDVHDY